MIDDIEIRVKPVKGYETLYKIDEYGIVYNIKRKTIIKWRYAYQRYNAKRTYKYIRLYKKGKGKSFPVHRLIALTFIPNPLNLPEVNHIDGDKDNNHISNLEWITHADNMKHAAEHGLMKQKKGDDFGRTRIQTSELREILDRLKAGEQVKDIAEERGIVRHTISRTFRRSSLEPEWRQWLADRIKKAS